MLTRVFAIILLALPLACGDRGTADNDTNTGTTAGASTAGVDRPLDGSSIVSPAVAERAQRFHVGGEGGREGADESEGPQDWGEATNEAHAAGRHEAAQKVTSFRWRSGVVAITRQEREETDAHAKARKARKSPGHADRGGRAYGTATGATFFISGCSFRISSTR